MDTYADSIEHLLEALAERDNITSMFAEPVRRVSADKTRSTVNGDGDDDDVEITTRPDDYNTLSEDTRRAIDNQVC